MKNPTSSRIFFLAIGILEISYADAFFGSPSTPILDRKIVVEAHPSGPGGEGGLSRREALDTSFSLAASGLLLPKGATADDVSTKPGKIPTIRLGGGKSILEIPRTIQGYWQLAGGHGRYSEREAIENMQAHFNAGITTLDTADIYGPSEIVVGKFVKSQPGAIPCTKFCCFRYLEVSPRNN